MTLTARENALAALALSGPVGDNEIRRAVLGLMADGLGFARDGDTLLGRLLVAGAEVGSVTTPGTTVAEEYGDAVTRITRLTMTAFSLGNVGDAANLGIGAKFYTLPPGSHMVENASIKGTFDAAVSSVASTPEIGIGTVIASGAVTVLGGTATFENVIEGATIADVGNEAIERIDEPNAAAPAPLLITTAGSHDLFLNAAAAWADVAAVAPLLFTGVVTLRWRKIG